MNIIITGAGRGLGLETLLKFQTERSHHILGLSRDIGAIPKVPGQVSSLGFDICQGDYNELGEWLSLHMPSVDVLINNAGQLRSKTFRESSPADYQEMLDVNFLGSINMIKAVYPFFNPTRAHIVNIGSMGGYQGSAKFRGLSAYSASKAALMNLTESLAEELKSQHINVNALALGSVQTEMLEQAFPGYQASMTATEMASFVANFAISGHHYFNGKILPVALSTP